MLSGNVELQHGRSQDVSGFVKCDGNSISQFQRFAVRDAGQPWDGGVDGLFGVQRHHRMLAAPAFLLVPALLVLGVFLLDLGRVAQDDLSQFDRGPRAVDGAVEPLFDQPRDQTAVVDVHVRQHQGIELCWGHGTGFPVAIQIGSLLQQATVDHDLGAGDFQAIARAGDLPIGAQKM